MALIALPRFSIHSFTPATSRHSFKGCSWYNGKTKRKMLLDLVHKIFKNTRFVSGTRHPAKVHNLPACCLCFPHPTHTCQTLECRKKGVFQKQSSGSSQETSRPACIQLSLCLCCSIQVNSFSSATETYFHLFLATCCIFKDINSSYW